MPDQRPWALFLDFDGTLVDIVPRPDAVEVHPGLADTLLDLRARLGGALAIVTGRQIAVVDRFLGPLGLDVAGLHGAERRLGGALSPVRIEDHPALGDAVARVKTFAATRPGLLVEDKIGSVALHWRLAPEREDEALAFLATLMDGLGPEFRLQPGKRVAEVLPASAAKGTVIAAMLDDPPYAGRRPVFIGDDLTDEAGFAVVNALDGVSLRVGPGQTRAAYRLGGPSEVRTFLTRWAERGEPDFGGFEVGAPGAPGQGRPVSGA